MTQGTFLWKWFEEAESANIFVRAYEATDPWGGQCPVFLVVP